MRELTTIRYLQLYSLFSFSPSACKLVNSILKKSKCPPEFDSVKPLCPPLPLWENPFISISHIQKHPSFPLCSSSSSEVNIFVAGFSRSATSGAAFIVYNNHDLIHQTGFTLPSHATQFQADCFTFVQALIWFTHHNFTAKCMDTCFGPCCHNFPR